MGRPSKRVAHMREQRASETNEEREKRLKNNRERNSLNITREEPNERKDKLSKKRAYMKTLLSNESMERRAHRFRTLSDRLANENDEQRTHRLGLIQDRLSNETNEQRTHRLGLIQDRLSNETNEQRTHRLGLIQDRLSNETNEQRTHRLGLIQDRLSNETNEQRVHRLGLIQDRLSNETNEQRTHRLGLIQDRLSNETNEQREHRLGLIQDRLSNETNEQREHRLGLIHERLSNETDEERSNRLAVMQMRSRERLSNEPLETRASRLDTMRHMSLVRRDLSRENDFESSINVYADASCGICNKSIYPKQRFDLNTEVYISLLPERLISLRKIITCSRCHTSIRKRKIPSVAYWNKMTPASIPPELSNLSTMEERFLCRIIPFLKIIKLQNRFSQDWCKGQVILFAKDVVEIAEQLPLTPSQTGLVLVVESLENLQHSKEFVVDVTRLKNALTWLISHNALYSDVRLHFDENIDITEIIQTVDEPINTERERLPELLPENHYAYINENVSILRGSFHQGDLRFDTQSRGKQCTGIATVASVAFSVLDPSLWASSDIDYILTRGDRYYSDCIAARDNPAPGELNPEYLNVTELLPEITYNREKVSINIHEEINYNGHMDNDNSSDGFPNLKNALEYFFRDHSHGILTVNATTVAIYSKSDVNGTSYWLLDSHARGPKGAIAPRRGTACCMRFRDLDDLHSLLRRNLYVTPKKSPKNDNIGDNLNVFSLTALTIFRENQTEIDITSFNNLQSRFDQVRSQEVSSVNQRCGDLSQQINEFTLQEQEAHTTHDTIFITSMLHHVDEAVPNLESVVNVNAPETDDNIRLAEITRKTAPPIHIERERRMEELGWYFLYPDGKNGFGEEREIPVTPLDYFQSRIMSNDQRFMRNDYLFYALSIVEYYRAKSSVSVSCRMRQGQGEQTPPGLVDNMHLTIRNIRGSASYWQKCCSELIAMVRSLGPPTWFMTFSCNDLHWPDMIRALLIADGGDVSEAENLSFPERLRLVQKYPVVVSRQFTLRVNALMRFLKRDQECLGGPVEDFWYRIEFQNRGSPHLHMLVWCKNVPDFSTPEGIRVIDNVISCSINSDDPELQKLIENVQMHKHTATCYKNHNNQRSNNQNSNTSCRFGFPRTASDNTVCLGPDEALLNNGRFCILKRSSEESMVNNYNKVLLNMWKGNIDVQPCGNVTAVSYYVAKYASKCEPHDTGEVVREAVAKAKRQGGNVWNQLFAVSMAILNQRLVSAPECAYRLCHLPLKMASRKAVFVNSCKPSERYRLVRFDSDETSVYNNIFDRYVLRPDNLEDLSLAEFAVRFETTSNQTWNEDNGDVELRDEETGPRKYITLRDNTRMQVRNKPAVLRTRYYTINSDKEAYYYNLIVCHIPFRNELELLLEEETAEDCFIRRQSDLRPLQGHESAEQFAHTEQVIQQALAQAVALNAARDAHDSTNNAPFLLCGGEQIINDEDNYCDEVSERAVMPDDIFLANIRALNVQQKKLFQTISAAIEKDLQGLDDQMLLFITGGAGSGKSFILKLIVEHIKRCYAPTVDILQKPNFVEIGSLTGVAARQIFGKTLHSIFSLPIEKKGNTMAYKKISGQKLENERRKWRHINWLIVDEISMVSYENLKIIHLRLQEYKNNEKLFGGVNILLFGDILQLPPVKGHWCYLQPPWLSAEINLWHQFSFCELTINMRQRNDTEFIDLLNSLRVGEITTGQLELLCERRHIPLSGEFEDGVAVRIYPTVRQVDVYNEKMTVENAKKQRMYIINAVDESREVATYGKKPPDNVIPKDVNNCGGLLPMIKLGIDSRVMLRRNISVSEGLVNGSMGIVKKIQWPALRRDQLEEGELPDAVLIKFDDDTIGLRLKDSDGCVAIAPSCTTFQATRGYGDIERRMLPLILSWAVTVHKLQGTTLDRAVIDLGKKNFAKGQIYVALSRVKTLQGIALSDLDSNKLLNRPHDDRSLQEMLRLRNLSTE